MSVKIYTGYKFKTTNLKEINILCTMLREKYLPLFEKDLISKIKDKETWDELNKRYVTETYYSTWLYENISYYNLHICFYPIKNYTLFIPFGFEEDFPKLNNKIEYYGYWDNVDPDDRCSKYMWNKRKNDWTEVILQHVSSTFKQYAFTKQITDRFDFGNILYNRELINKLKEQI